MVAVKSCLSKSFGVALVFRNGYESPVQWNDGAIHFGIQKTKIDDNIVSKVVIHFEKRSLMLYGF